MLYVLNYRGKSFVSAAIKLITWSRYSHTAICETGGKTIEAWHIGGVLLGETPWSNHKPNTPIDVFAFTERVNTVKLWNFFQYELSKPYDFRALLGFLPWSRWLWKDDPNKWFCSHLVVEKCKQVGYSLFSDRTPMYKVYPGMVEYSPKLKYIGTVHNMNEFDELMSRNNCIPEK